MLGYVGCMGIQDGVDYLIRALAVLRETRNDFHAVLVGRGSAIEGLKKLTHELELDDYVSFPGFVELRVVPRFLATFDICLTPDPSNPYNDSCTTIKTMEYMAIAKPTVAFRTRENEITAGASALYADNNDIREYARLIAHLMDHPEQRATMGRIGRQRIVDSLDWSPPTQETVAGLRSVVLRTET